MTFVFLLTDLFFFFFIFLVISFFIRAHFNELTKEVLIYIFKGKLALISSFIISLYIIIALLDSIHYKPIRYDKDLNAIQDREGNVTYYKVRSLFDTLLAKVYKGIQDKNGTIISNDEESYSQSFANTRFDKIFEPDENGIPKPVIKTLNHPGTHFLGTGKAGEDIFYKLLKGIRTALIVGLVTTLIALPFAIFLGILAGYFGGFIDDVIQFIYTTLSSIPSILLIVSMVMILNTRLGQDSADAIYARDDKMVLGICCILGILGWSHLCRLLRAETLKIKELEFIQAAKAQGSSHLRIIFKHILPNVMHIILISFILSFSSLVMVEAILQYINVGVPENVYSWGRVIDGAREELGRDPMVTWPVLGTFFFMFILIISVNILGDRVRDALDPKTQKS